MNGNHYIKSNRITRLAAIHPTAGMSRLVVIMALAVLALSIPIIWSAAMGVKADTEQKECAVAIGSAQRKLDDEYIANPDMTPEEAEAAATSEIRSLEGTCPGGGTYVIVKKQDGKGYKIYCDLHKKE